MAILLNPDVYRHLPHLPNLWLFRYTIPTVGANSTGARYALLMDEKQGIIQQLRIAITEPETVAQLFMYSEENANRGSIYEIIRTPAIDPCFAQGNLGIIYQNEDSPQTTALYAELDNGGALSTGDIELELIVQFTGSD